MLRRTFVCLLPLAAAAPAGAQTPPRFREIKWDELVPAGWDPMKDLKDLQQLDGLTDADPRAAELLKKMRAVWDQAPSNPALDGQNVRIPGYVVPLEEGKDGVAEFLLVPYFGACIHSPPPPANQIIHVLPRSVAKGVRSMDAVWVSGTLRREKVDSLMGTAGYRLQALKVEPYVQPSR
ncbi:MAG: DUF3299 domain-containing protein [Proteobacteria bacterium]|nr:DUF3299 domain-containing protein [Pseudomonadota bacterium]